MNYRFNLQFGCSPDNDRAAGFLQRMGRRKSAVVVQALCAYLDRHPELERSANEKKAGNPPVVLRREVKPTREEIKEIVREVLAEALRSQGAVQPVLDRQDAGIAALLDDLDGMA